MNIKRSGGIIFFIFLAAFFIGAVFLTQKANIGGLIMIGPIPIAFGNSPEVTIVAMLFGILLMVLFFVAGHRKDNEGASGIPSQDIIEGSGQNVKGGGVIFIGPIPIIFGSDKRSAIIVILLAIILMLLALVFQFH